MYGDRTLSINMIFSFASIFKKIDKKWFILAAILSIYPVGILSYVWYNCYVSEFEGGENGQLDAYRHTLASAVVSYTLSPVVVEVFTSVTEFPDADAYVMDRHNNNIGKNIGNQATSFKQINGLIIEAVKKGAESTADPNQVTWLGKSTWGDYLFWWLIAAN